MTHALWLSWMGALLVHNDGPAKADIAVVLAGDYYGRRLIHAAELVKAGYVPNVLVSGPRGLYGVYECDVAIPFAVRKGYPAEWFIAAPHSALSTAEEARALLPLLRRLKVRSYLLVTSNFHTARARRVFRAAARELGVGFEMRVVAAQDEFFDPREWWHTRQGQKRVFLEWSKTLATAVGL
jgi:uncharacterized SAM-binding protein YcdF (DUF218 family)